LTNAGPIYLEVAVAVPLDHTLIYSIAVDKAVGLTPGVRLLVPLAGRFVTGYLLALCGELPPEAASVRTIKPVADVLDAFPLFPENLIPVFRWVAQYYQHPIGEVIRMALPAGLTVKSGRRIILSKAGRPPLAEILASETGKAFPWLQVLLEKNMLTAAATSRVWRSQKGRRLLEQWRQNGWLTIKEELSAATVKARTEICVAASHLDCVDEFCDELKPSEQKTLRLLSRLSIAGGGSSIPRKDLIKAYAGARKALKNLEKKRLIFFEERQVYRDPFGERPPFFAQPERLTAEQEDAVKQVNPAISRKKFSTFLLHGVTGSGKTEVYLRAAATTLEQSRSVLVLVPEIALATQLEGHFVSRFGDRVALLHSGLSAGEHYDQWMRIMTGEASIVIGARSAVFAPLRDPGLIVVDEEHEGAYKQEEGLRYQARDLAILRASRQNATVILGSATPSVTSYFHAINGKYQLLTIGRRINERPLPTVSVVDLRKNKNADGAPVLFSNELLAALNENLDRGEQSLIFLNRRGYADFMLCRDCGQTVQCRNCQISLTLHKDRGALLCHYCGYTLSSAVLCPHCRSSNIGAIGFGTERLEAELGELLPQARIARLDRDTCVKRKHYLAVLNKVRQRRVDILLGTQMITKGHHFPHMTLVGIVWADAGLGLPDFRAGERTFQLIAQVAGRAGRETLPGRVIIQTYHPDHYCIDLARTHDYKNLFEKEIQSRREVAFPPFSRLINIRLEGEDPDKVRNLAHGMTTLAGKLCRTRRTVDVLGPAPAPLAKLRGRYRWQFLLKGPDVETLHAFCNRLLSKARQTGIKAVRISVDVDPEHMM